MNDLQKEAVAVVMERYWGGHMQTGMDGDILTIWTKMGPNSKAEEHRISPGGHIKTTDIEWDGREHF